MAKYDGYTTTAKREAALQRVTAAANAALPEGSTPLTTKDYLFARLDGVLDSYAADDDRATALAKLSADDKKVLGISG